MLTRAEELDQKLARIRLLLSEDRVLRLRGIDWFAWLLSGASNGVLLAAETGVAEALVTPAELYVLTDEIEAERLIDEELPGNVQVQRFPWAQPALQEDWVRQTAGAAHILSDRPARGESPLPDTLRRMKLELTPSELQRYSLIGAAAASAMTEVLLAARPHWTEFELAGAGARALLARGLQPALILAVGAGRLPRYRHPLPTHAPLEQMAMMVFCARGAGLYANLTRFVNFGPMPSALVDAHQQIREIEAEALDQCTPGVGVAEMYLAFERAYARHGYPDAITQHHQGGLTGYQAREVVARPNSPEIIQQNMVVAWNPSVPGAKIEDTFVVGSTGLTNLTFDADWPHSMVRGRTRPLVLCC